VPGASSGAIIPVNAVPGNNQLTIWWFRKVAAPNANFQNFFVASKIGRYNSAIYDQERAFVIELIGILGMPYAGGDHAFTP
jgi:hypothetical protein